jgi:PhnB protein
VAKVNVYLNFKGTTESAFKYYQSIFGGEFQMVQRYKEVPGLPPMSPIDGDKLMHIALPITSNLVIHGTDSVDGMGPMLVMGNNVSLMVEADTKQDADRFFKLLSAGGSDLQPMKDEFWGDYYGQCTDKFGLKWMVDYEYPKQM